MAFAPLIAMAVASASSAAGSAAAAGSTLAAVSSYATVASTLIGAASGAASSVSAADQAKYNAQVATNNAKISAANTRNTFQQGAQEEEQEGLKIRGQIGQEVTQTAAAGLDVNSGSAVARRTSISQLGEASVANIRSNTLRTASQYDQQRIDYQEQAQQDKSAATNDYVQAGLSVVGSLAGGVSSLASNSIKFAQLGLQAPSVVK